MLRANGNSKMNFKPGKIYSTKGIDAKSCRGITATKNQHANENH